MLERILGRAKEPSSYAGIAAILLGLSNIFKINEATGIADAAVAASEIVVETGSPWLGITALLAGVVAVLRKE